MASGSEQASLAADAGDDRSGLTFSVLSSLCTMSAYYYLQPLGDTLALAMGLEYTPLVTVGNMCLIVALNPIYAAVVRGLPVDRIMPVMFRAVCTALLLFAAAFAWLPAQKELSFGFAVYVGTISLFTTTTLNARLASLHTKAQAKRLYGFIAAGSQAGQLLSSTSAPLLYGQLGNLVVVCSAGLYEASVQLMLLRERFGASPPAPAPKAGGGGGGAGAGGGGGADGDGGGGDAAAAAGSGRGGCARGLRSAFGGFAILASTRFLRAVTLHTLLGTFLVSGVWYERAAAVAAAFATDEARYDFFSRLNALVSVATLALQTLCFAGILERCGFHRTLVAEPLATIAGLGVAIVRPGLLSIAMLDGMRKVIHYALSKPTKEGLYAALPREVVFVAKPLLDTLVYRGGSLVGAAYFTAAIGGGLTPLMRQCLLLVVAVGWAAVSFWLGLLAEREQAAREAARAGSAGGIRDLI